MSSALLLVLGMILPPWGENLLREVCILNHYSTNIREWKVFFRKNFRKNEAAPDYTGLEGGMDLENRDINEQQVWQRVMAQPEDPARDDLRGLLLAAMELAAAYRYLAGALTGRQRERAKRLHEGEQANIACLKGIGILSGRGEEVLKIWNPSKEPGRKLLEKCYHKSRRCMVEYMSRSAETEFGTVFRKMADREGEHCAWIAELLGSKS